jgi:protein phosphatase
VPVEAGDRLLLCTDGLTEMVPDVEFLGLLQRAAGPSAACHRLIDRANEQGGRDNVTVVVAFFGEAQPASTLRPA